jgi:hypothetical protein
MPTDYDFTPSADGVNNSTPTQSEFAGYGGGNANISQKNGSFGGTTQKPNVGIDNIFDKPNNTSNTAVGGKAAQRSAIPTGGSSHPTNTSTGGNNFNANSNRQSGNNGNNRRPPKGRKGNKGRKK